MDQRTQSNGLRTFLEHWGFLFVVLTAFLVSQVLSFFTELKGLPWIWFFVAAFALMIAGAGLIGYSKFPVYRAGCFWTFGIKSIPERLVGFYRWGWRLVVFGVVLALGLLLSH